MQSNSQVDTIWQQIKLPLMVLGGFIVVIWLIEIADWIIFSGSLDAYGIRPRTLNGLWGIVTAPFLHGGFGHLMANTLPVLILGGLIIVSRGLKEFFMATAVIMLISGLGTWIIGPTASVHIGASGLIFGYFGMLLTMAYFERSCQSIVVSILVFFFYGGLIWGILPRADGISWQTHLFGLVGGVFAAYILGTQAQTQTPETPSSWDDDIVVHESYDS
ncbi:MAG: rhomboid family intramembrane serine protease [Chloroflexi bacterium]|nr:rhomboid family intramembrane serine protease [Chloroflexota bacterium]